MAKTSNKSSRTVSGAKSNPAFGSLFNKAVKDISKAAKKQASTLSLPKSGSSTPSGAKHTDADLAEAYAQRQRDSMQRQQPNIAYRPELGGAFSPKENAGFDKAKSEFKEQDASVDENGKKDKKKKKANSKNTVQDAIAQAASLAPDAKETLARGIPGYSAAAKFAPGLSSPLMLMDELAQTYGMLNGAIDPEIRNNIQQNQIKETDEAAGYGQLSDIDNKQNNQPIGQGSDEANDNPEYVQQQADKLVASGALLPDSYKKSIENQKKAKGQGSDEKNDIDKNNTLGMMNRAESNLAGQQIDYLEDPTAGMYAMPSAENLEHMTNEERQDWEDLTSELLADTAITVMPIGGIAGAGISGAGRAIGKVVPKVADKAILRSGKMADAMGNLGRWWKGMPGEANVAKEAAKKAKTVGEAVAESGKVTSGMPYKASKALQDALKQFVGPVKTAAKNPDVVAKADKAAKAVDSAAQWAKRGDTLDKITRGGEKFAEGAAKVDRALSHPWTTGTNVATGFYGSPEAEALLKAGGLAGNHLEDIANALPYIPSVGLMNVSDETAQRAAEVQDMMENPTDIQDWMARSKKDNPNWWSAYTTPASGKLVGEYLDKLQKDIMENPEKYNIEGEGSKDEPEKKLSEEAIRWGLTQNDLDTMYENELYNKVMWNEDYNKLLREALGDEAAEKYNDFGKFGYLGETTDYSDRAEISRAILGLDKKHPELVIPGLMEMYEQEGIITPDMSDDEKVQAFMDAHWAAGNIVNANQYLGNADYQASHAFRGGTAGFDYAKAFANSGLLGEGFMNDVFYNIPTIQGPDGKTIDWNQLDTDDFAALMNAGNLYSQAQNGWEADDEDVRRISSALGVAGDPSSFAVLPEGQTSYGGYESVNWNPGSRTFMAKDLISAIMAAYAGEDYSGLNPAIEDWGQVGSWDLADFYMNLLQNSLGNGRKIGRKSR